ncbi:MAG: ArsR family transcriptional regulator [Microbacteriaceae bacterium]|nr:ArsR family transcriptional regulator [Microbacteriaceae bacterium]
MSSHRDIDALRPELAAATARGGDAVRAVLHPVAHELAVEDGVRFRELVMGLPESSWHDDVIITTALGTSYRSPGSPEGSSALAYLRAAEKLLRRDPGAADHARAEVQLAFAASLRVQGRLLDAEVRLLEVEELLEHGDHGPASHRLAARHQLEAGVTDLLLGRLHTARHRLEFAHGLAVHLTRSERIECLGALALASYAQGDLASTDRAIAEARAIDAPDGLLASAFAAPMYAAEVLVSTDRYDLDRLAELSEAMTAASAHAEWRPFAWVVTAYSQSLRGEAIAALDSLHHAHQRYLSWPTPGIGLDIGELLRAEILASLDRGDEAYRILSRIDPHERHALCPQRFMARIALQHGDVRGARAALADCERLGETHSPRTSIDVQLLRAATELEGGAPALSDMSFDRALHAMARTGVQSPLRHVPPALLARLAQRAITRRQGPEERRMLERILEATEGHEHDREPLSERERLVLAYVERELTVAQIAAELYISPNTVKTHLRRLYQKLGVTTREEAIRRARALGLHLAPAPDAAPNAAAPDTVRGITRESPGPGD